MAESAQPWLCLQCKCVRGATWGLRHLKKACWQAGRVRGQGRHAAILCIDVRAICRRPLMRYSGWCSRWEGTLGIDFNEHGTTGSWARLERASKRCKSSAVGIYWALEDATPFWAPAPNRPAVDRVGGVRIGHP
jgi:hypothetical protein